MLIVLIGGFKLVRKHEKHYSGVQQILWVFRGTEMLNYQARKDQKTLLGMTEVIVTSSITS